MEVKAARSAGRASGQRGSLRVNRILRLDWLGAAFGVALVFALLSVLSPYFLTSDNILTILVQTAVVAILAGGQTFVILTAQIDLATAAAAALAGAVIPPITEEPSADNSAMKVDPSSGMVM